ncbi:transposase [Dactylosporangium sp. NPDC049140]|uniref:transposase n=1 Tax=Dactylosporangium sp. NPDC049140 TaxID=3155647 RepID=UPI0033FBDFC3
MEPFEQAGKYVAALVSDLPRKNGWTIAEHAGDGCPDPTQRLLNHAVWDHDAAMAAMAGSWSRRCAVSLSSWRCWIGYVLRVGRAFHTDLAAGMRLRADAVVSTVSSTQDSWQIQAVPGSKGDRRYAWAWVATSSPHHVLLLRRHLQTGEVAYHYCHVPPGRQVPLMTLVRMACLRWPVEEDFEFGKDHFGLDHSQVRLYTALTRHLVLAMAALAVCAVTAAQAKTRAPAPILPSSPNENPPTDTGLIAFTVAEIKRLFVLITRRPHTDAHHLHWTWWRRRHQARARWFHHRTRLARQATT